MGRKLEDIGRIARGLTIQGSSEATAVGQFIEDFLESADQYQTQDGAIRQLRFSLEELCGWARTASADVTAVLKGKKL